MAQVPGINNGGNVDPNGLPTERVDTNVIRSALESQNPQYAADYMAAHKSEMTTDDLLRVEGLVNQQSTAQMVQGAVAKRAAQLQPAVAPSDMDRLTGLVAQQESGGNPNAVGPEIPGQGTAKGTMQVMDATAMNPGMGIAPAKKLPDGSIDPVDRARVGRDYLGALVKKYGNVPQALAAYNAGPDTVDKAITAAKGMGEPGLWLQAMGDFQSESNHDQTVNYVQAISQKYGQGGGAAPMPTKGDFVQGVLDDLGPGATPQAITMARQSAEARYQLTLDSRNEQGDQALRQVQQALVANGGDYSALQRDNPDLVSSLTRWAPGKVDDAVKFSKNIAKGENVTNMDAYGSVVSHPEDLGKMSDAEMAQFVNTNMSQADGRYLYKLRAEIQAGKVDTGPQSINQAALTSKLDRTLLDLGLDPKDKSNRTQYGDIQQSFVTQILSQQQAQGKKFTAADINAFVDQQAARQNITTHWYRSDTQAPVLTSQFSDAPDNVQQQLKDAFAAHGVKSPTDAQLTRAWLTYKLKTPDAN